MKKKFTISKELREFLPKTRRQILHRERQEIKDDIERIRLRDKERNELLDRVIKREQG